MVDLVIQLTLAEEATLFMLLEDRIFSWTSVDELHFK